MIAFLRRHIITLSTLIVCTAIGFLFYLKEAPVSIWRIEYEFRSENEANLQEIAKTDTVFEHEGIICRNITGSLADTLVEQGIRRHELKVYMQENSEEAIIRLGKEIVETPDVKVINNRFGESQKDKRKILYWALFGFFLGILAEFVISLVKKPRPQ